MTDDPFDFGDDDDKTVLRPNFRGPATAPMPDVAQLNSNNLPQLGGINKLEKAASRLLPLLITIKNSSDHPNPDQLRSKLINELNGFKQDALKVLNDPKKVTQASYVMCTVLDEAAMNTPWGHRANWAQHNLLSTFHNEVIGGERFFELLKGLGRNPADNIDLLELMYVCLSLGYEGTYRIAKNGQNTLVKVRKWLYEIIKSTRNEPEAALSSQWLGSGVKESKLPRLTALWVVGAAALALCSVAYAGYRFSLGQASEDAVAKFYQVGVEQPQFSSIELAPPVASLTLTERLQQPIDNGSLLVEESNDQGLIRLLGNNLFASGRDTLNEEISPLVNTIAAVLEQYDGSVLVTGHSDNIPIRSGRFASNLELSEARATSVAQLLEAGLSAPERIKAEGRGDTIPIADNSKPEGRSLNRRVEIIIYYY